jgi:hypothetical protein
MGQVMEGQAAWLGVAAQAGLAWALEVLAAWPGAAVAQQQQGSDSTLVSPEAL